MLIHTHTCTAPYNVAIFSGKTQSFPRGTQKHLVCAKAEAQPAQSVCSPGSHAVHIPGACGAGGRVGISLITMINTAEGCSENPWKEKK